ncbi:MAG: hypothetical protein DIU68_020190 [Chloroflexota bacterium]|nr:MAG: hypothetical protein DIU68_21325 [Chloroflexota bacterium]
MGVLYLLTLALFVAALAYFTVLVTGELVHTAQRRLAGGPPQPRDEHTAAGQLRRATQEISAIFGLGDD